MKLFLVNLCSDFNPNSLLPWFVAYTSQGNLLLFEELMLSPIPENLELSAVEGKLYSLVRQIKNQNLSSESGFDEYKIGFILGYDPWLFTQCNEFSKFPLFKVEFLRNKLNDLLGNQFDNIEISYFFLGIKSNPIHLYIDDIEKNGLISDHCDNDQSVLGFNWLKKKDIRKLFENAKKNELPVLLFNEINGVFSSKCPLALDTLKIEPTLGNLNISGKEIGEQVKVFGAYLQKKIGLSHNLLKNEFDIRFVIDNTNVNANLLSSGKIAIFILESFQNELRIKVFKDFKNISITGIELNKDQLEAFVSKLRAILSGRELLEPSNKSSENFCFKVYSLPDDDQTKQVPFLDNNDEVNYCNHYNIKSKIGFFHCSDRYNKVRNLLYEKNIEPHENKVFSFKDDIFLSPVYSNLSHTINEKPLNIIEQELSKRKESLDSLSSAIDYDEYYRIKQEIIKEINELRKTILERLFVLPGITASISILALSFITVLIFGLPLYSLKNYINSFVFSGIFLVLHLGVFIVLLSIFKKKITTILTLLESKHHMLFSELRKLESSIRKVAKDLRQSYIDRKNIEELENCIRDYEIKEMKKKKYLQFFEDINRKLADLEIANQIFTGGRTSVHEIKSLDIPPILNEKFSYKPSKESSKIKIEFVDNRQTSYEVEIGHECLIHKIELLTNNT